jgi:hypothetical protein
MRQGWRGALPNHRTRAADVGDALGGRGITTREPAHERARVVPLGISERDGEQSVDSAAGSVRSRSVRTSSGRALSGGSPVTAASVAQRPRAAPLDGLEKRTLVEVARLHAGIIRGGGTVVAQCCADPG